MVYKLCGHTLFRGAKEQAAQGEVLSFIEESEAGDLAFFDNEEGEIIHVGIILKEPPLLCIKILVIMSCCQRNSNIISTVQYSTVWIGIYSSIIPKQLTSFTNNCNPIVFELKCVEFK